MTVPSAVRRKDPTEGLERARPLIDTERLLPLSAGQRRLWLLDHLNPDDAAYSVNNVLVLTGDLDTEALRRAVETTVRRHEALRTCYPTVGGVPYQLVRDSVDVQFATYDERSAGPNAAWERIRAAARLPFDLARGPLFRTVLVRSGAEKHLLLMNVHHSVADGWSTGLIMRDILACYSAQLGHVEPPPPPAAQYRDFVRWQRDRQHSPDIADQLEYWKDQLAGPLGVVRLPADDTRPAARSAKGGTSAFAVPPELTDTLADLCRQTRTTPYIVLLAAFKVLLYRYTRQTDVVVGSPVANRTRREFEDVVGYLGNTLAMRTDLSGNPTFRDVLDRVRRTALDAFTHQDVPFDTVVEAVAPTRETDVSPVFQTSFVLQSDPVTVASEELSVQAVPIDNGSAKFDLTLNMAEDGDQLLGRFEYSRDLFGTASMDRLVANHLTLLHACLTRPDTPIDYLPLLASEEAATLARWNDTTRPSPSGVPVDELFRRQIDRRPAATALVEGDRRWTYRELGEWVDDLAGALRDGGLRRGDRVGIAVERSAATIAWMLAAVRAGGAFVHFDPQYPDERLRLLIDDAAPRFVVAAEDVRARMGFDPNHTLAPDHRPGSSAVAVDRAFEPTDLACVVYTSGSTGRPKGVALSHQGITALVCDVDELQVRPDDVVAQATPLTFDASLFDVFGALLNGAALALAPPGPETLDELCALFSATGVTVLQLTPGLFRRLEPRHLADLGGLRLLLSGGDIMSVRAARDFLTEVPNCTLLNIYGPTENTQLTSVHRVTAVDTTRAVPIGRPLPNTTVDIVDPAGQPVPIGVPGELYAGGMGVANGYLNLAEMNAERFVADPRRPGARRYRTGDRARWRHDGTLEFLGRLDDQVKIRGFRVEPAEVHAALVTDERIADAAVTVVRNDDGDRQLVAYLVAATDDLDVRQIRARLEESLPRYLQPAFLVPVPSLPLTRHGKVDFARLPDPRVGFEPTVDEYVAPTTELERQLAAIWCQVLKADRVGIDDDFFELGGDSIISIQIVARARRAGVRVSPRDILDARTIRRLAAQGAGGQPEAVPEVAAVTGEPFRLSPIQRWFLEQPLPAREHFNMSQLFELDAHVDPDLLRHALAALVEHHDALRLRLVGPPDAPAQQYGGETAVDLVRLDLSGCPEAEQWGRLEQHAARLQRQIRLDGGGLLRALHVDRGDEPAWLLLIIHHLAVDGISWRILIDDLREAYQQLSDGRRPELPARTASFQQWVEALHTAARSTTAQAAATYWMETLPTETAPLPTDRDGTNSRASTARVTVSLDEAQTEALLRRAPRAYRSEINDILLGAFSITMSRWTGRRETFVALESHGREDLGTGLDTSRTVGWFTGLYPVLITAEDHFADDPGAAVRSVKEQLRRVPDHGVPYGLVRYLTGDSAQARSLTAAPWPEVSFNYLGQYTGAEQDDSPIALSPRLVSSDRSNEGQRSFLIEVNGSVVGGRLRLIWTYSTQCHTTETVHRLADDYRATLVRIVEHCAERASTTFTPSDFPLSGLDQAQLDQLLADGRPIEDIWPATPLQQGLMFHSLFEPEAGMYLVQWCADFVGAFDPEHYEQACRQVLRRHPALRVQYAWAGANRLVQVVRPDPELTVAHRELRDAPAHDQPGLLDRFLTEDRERGLEPFGEPPIRVTILRLGDDRCRVVWTYHHALLDGWTFTLVMNEIADSYRAACSGREAMPQARPSYRGYLDWRSGRDPERAAAYWRDHLSGISGPTVLGIERPSDACVNERFSHCLTTLSAERTERLRTLAQAAGITLNTLCLGAWALTAARYSGDPSVVVGVTSSGRPPELAGVEQMVGLFINTLPLRLPVEPSAPVNRWLREVQAAQWRMRDFEDSALSAVQEWVGLNGQASLFEHIFVFENYPVEDLYEQDWHGARIASRYSVERTNYPLDVLVRPGAELQVQIGYDRNRYPEPAVEQLLRHYVHVLDALLSEPERELGAISMADDDETRALLRRYAPPYQLPAHDDVVHRRFERQVELTPHAPAIAYGTDELTYDGLNQRANNLAAHLLANGVGKGSFVAISSTRCVEMLVGMLAILKAGAAYVPISHKYPPERIAQMMDDAAVTALITRRDLADPLPEHPARQVYLEDWSSAPDRRLPNPEVAVCVDDPVYVYFTSGSTGRPKGVLVHHGGLTTTVTGYSTAYELDRRTTVHLQMSNMSFDVFTADWTRALCNGKKLVLCPADLLLDSAGLLDLIRRERVDFAEFIPVVLRRLIDHLERTDQRLSALEVAICGSDVWYGDEYMRFRRLLGPQTRLVNSYGVTEATVDNAMYEDRAADLVPGRPVPVGGPSPNEQLLVLDENGALQPTDVPGELCIGGPAVAQGYLGAEELTRQRFVPNPFDPRGGRMYRTGDLARYSSQGYVELLGRADDQVKIRGFRIELGEVEVALEQHPAVARAVVAVRRLSRDDAGLVAYLVPAGTTLPTVSAFRGFLRGTLPWFMIPTTYETIAEVPTNNNGKVDRSALPQPSTERPDVAAAFEAPSTDTERRVATAWSEVLGLPEVGVTDDFVELGGSSLRAMEVAFRVRRDVGANPTIRDVLLYPTIREFCAALPSFGAVAEEVCHERV
ncbi:amino acid adenylation domain-containing protein [Micromonospora sp. H61]|uniref:non-ribosomal peptide synthetase n=1 Tax=Micromonospora sp. H61 TaxID=2824888 RepID=UPI001B35E35E|nr:non-ribosomal peptide synthetase [Micromonospora sp. H61]MBQ0988762.1 amino acid adenylation domain-containing protein [Micromonospora sp. H61]